MPKPRKQKKRTEPRQIVVTVADDALDNIHGVADELKKHGVKVDRVMPVTGVITGTYSAPARSALEKIRGVLSVEDELVAELPPPDSTQQ